MTDSSGDASGSCLIVIRTELSVCSISWGLEPQSVHRLKCCVQALSYVLVRWLRELVDESNERSVSRKLLVENILRCDASRKQSWAFHLDAIVEDANLHVR